MPRTGKGCISVRWGRAGITATATIGGYSLFGMQYTKIRECAMMILFASSSTASETCLQHRWERHRTQRSRPPRREDANAIEYCTATPLPSPRTGPAHRPRTTRESPPRTAPAGARNDSRWKTCSGSQRHWPTTEMQPAHTTAAKSRMGPGMRQRNMRSFCLEHVLRAEPRHTSAEQALGLPRPSQYQFHRDVDLLHALLAQSQVSGIMRQIRMPAHAERIDAFLDRRLVDGRI